MWWAREKEREEERKKNGVLDDDEDLDGVGPCETALRNRILHGIVAVILLAIIVPIIIYVVFVDSKIDESVSTHTCLVLQEYQVPCGWENIDAVNCWSVACCYNETTHECYHSLPSSYIYKSNDEWPENAIFNPSRKQTPFGNSSLSELKLSIKEISATELAIILYSNQTEPQYEQIENTDYSINVYNEEMAVEVTRLESNALILSTAKGPAIASNGYWEWTVQLTTEQLFGLDLLRIPDNVTTTKVVYRSQEDHTTLPMFMAYANGSFHGLFIEHYGPLEILVLPSKLIVLRSLIGKDLTLHLYTGPRPIDVYQQMRPQTSFIEVPYWTLGLHICRDGQFTNSSLALTEMRQFQDAADAVSLPYDSDCIHENLFSLGMNVTAEQKGLLQDAVDKLHDGGIKFVMSLAPQIEAGDSPAYNSATVMDILYKYGDEDRFLNGTYLGNTVAYPDYTETSQSWFESNFIDVGIENLDVDGFVLRSNWPADENYTAILTGSFPYYTPEIENSFFHNLPWDSVDSDGVEEIYHHNLYGSKHADVIRRAFPTLDLLLTASYFPGYSGHGAHVQDVDVTWVNLKKAITNTITYSMFGVTTLSIPVCGTNQFDAVTQEGLCIRWYYTAATLPFMRISSDLPRRDPTSLQTGYAQNAVLDVINKRYSLLPYYSTVLNNQLPLLRPMFFDFYQDNETLYLDEQYMLGDSLLVAQIVLPEKTSIRMYLPKDRTWYEFWGGRQTTGNGWLEIPVVQTDWIMFISAGKILPIQSNTRNTADASRLEPLCLAVAMDCQSDGCTASGNLYVSYYTNLEFSMNDTILQISNIAKAKPYLCDEESVATSIISCLKVYGWNPTHIEEIGDIDIDICDIDSDVLSINVEV